MIIKQEQAKVEEVEGTLDKCCKDDNSSWADKYAIQIYSFITKGKGKKENRGEIWYKRQVIQCTFE